MKTSSDFADFCLDLLAGVGPVEARSLFGGHAFYVGPAMLAIGDADEWKLWLKVDDATRARFEEAGGAPFVYTAKGRKRVTMSFVTPPEDAMEEADAMLHWARLALEAAERAAAKRRVKRPASPKPGPKAKPAAKKADRR
jgi:DNA transformation protein